MPVTNYIWDEENDSLLMETDENGDTTVVYTNEPDHHGRLISQHRDGETSYYHFDATGSTQALTNDAGDVIDSYLYDAFGVPFSVAGTTQNPFRYVGEFGYYFDTELLSIYVRARVYKPLLARWLSLDPAAFDLPSSQYKYAINSPLVVLDPSGLSPDCKPNEYPPGKAICQHPFHTVCNTKRGKFELIDLDNYASKGWWDRGVGSTMTFQWTWLDGAFVDPCGTCCCKKVGFIQTAKKRATFGGGLPENQDWHIDGNVPYDEKGTRAPTSRNPCVKGSGQHGIGFTDSPNGPAWGLKGRLLYLKQDFEVCAVCFEGCEGIDIETTWYGDSYLSGITVYGCLRWGHTLRWRNKIKGYEYKRYVDGVGTASGSGGAITTPIGGSISGDCPRKTEWEDIVYAYYD